MSKKIFVLLIIFMSLSLIGIILLQAYYIKGAELNQRERFVSNVKKTLANVSNTIETNEIDSYFEKFQSLDSEKRVDTAVVSQLFTSLRNRSEEHTSELQSRENL